MSTIIHTIRLDEELVSCK